MKPFDPESAQRGEPIMFRDGTPCTFGSVRPDGNLVHVWVDRPDMQCGVFRDMSGVIKGSNVPSRYDIVMAPRKVVRFMVVSPSVRDLHDTEQEAIKQCEAYARHGKDAVVARVEWEE